MQTQSLNIQQEKSTKDAAAVKVLTIIGLIYLPTTLVTVSSRVPWIQGSSDEV